MFSSDESRVQEIKNITDINDIKDIKSVFFINIEIIFTPN